MKILITTGIFKPEAGGPASYAENLATKLVDLGHEVKIITYSDKKSYDFDENYNFPLIRIVRKNKIFNYFKYFLAVLKNLKNYDLVYCLDHSSAGLPVFLATRLIRKKYIVRIGGDFIWEKYINSGQTPVTLQDFYYKNIYKKYGQLFKISQKILQNAEQIIFNSQIQKDLFIKYYYLKAKTVNVIYNPIPQFNYDVQREEIEKKIVFFGRFIKVKNIDLIIKAFAKLEDKEFKLLLIGDGPERVSLINLVKKLDLESRLDILPAMHGEELWQRVLSCYYVILPSWSDVAPNQVYECLRLRVPILLTQEHYLPLDTSAWLKINPASVEDITTKMNSLLDQGNYDDFVKTQMSFDFKNSWDDVVTKHLELFKKVL